MSWTKLRQQIDAHFNNEELRTLCFDLDVDYESLGGEGKEGKVRELLAWSKRNHHIPELITALTILRPNVAWREIEASIAADANSKGRDALTGVETAQEGSGSAATSKETISLSPVTRLLKNRAEELFYTLDDGSVEPFPSMVKGAIRVQILGRTAVNLLGAYQKIFAELGDDGCEIQLLFVDPDRPAFRVNRDDKWYGVFRDEFSQLWMESSEWSASDYLDAQAEKGEV